MHLALVLRYNHSNNEIHYSDQLQSHEKEKDAYIYQTQQLSSPYVSAGGKPHLRLKMANSPKIKHFSLYSS